MLVWKLDRFGRSLVNCVAGIQEFAALGVRFIAVSQGLDTDATSPTAQLLLHILAAVAQFERELIRERVAVGMKLAKEKGKHIGRPRREIDARRIVQMREGGMSFPAIARELGVGQATIIRAIQGLSKRVCPQ